MKTNVLSVDGKKKSEMTLPAVFSTNFRPDLIKRAVLSIQSKRYQTQSRDKMAGKRKSVFLSKKRRSYRGVYGAGRSRTPRKVLFRRGRQFRYEGAFAPQTRGGRPAHPPKSEKITKQKINAKEKLLATKSAIAATANKDIVKTDLKIPLVFEDKIESLKKTKDVEKLLKSAKISPKGVGPLFVVSEKCDLQKSARAIGDISTVKNLNAELLAPGARAGRLCLWSQTAIKKAGEIFGG